MRKSVLLVISVMHLLFGCAVQKPMPLVSECPSPPQLPPLKQLPKEVTQASFLDRLDQRMWKKPTEQTPSESNYWPATTNTKLQGKP